MPSFLDSLVTSVKSGFATAQSTFNAFVDDSRATDTTRPRIGAEDPTAAIDKSTGVQILNFPHDRAKYYITFAFEDYRRPSQFEGLTSAGLTDYICLPMPSALRDNNTLQWSVDEGSFLIEGITQTWRDGIDSYQTNGVQGLLDAAGNLVNDTGSLGTGFAIKSAVMAAAGLAKAAGADNFVGNALQIAGLADNPFMTVAFHGPNFKTHGFTWRLSPKTPKRVQRSRRLVTPLRRSHTLRF
jgi:hypothetical protein